MTWRGQGGKRAKGRRGDQEPELDNTAWLAELEREAAKADVEEEDWASTLRGRRSPAQPSPPAPPPPTSAPLPSDPGPPPPAPAAEPSWMPPPDPALPPPDYRFLGTEPDHSGSSRWDADPAPQDPPYTPSPAPEPDWSSWRPGAPEGLGEPGLAEPERTGPGESRPGGATDREGFWDSERPRQAEPDWRTSRADPGQEAWSPAGAETPTGAWSPVEPVGREPDYPALFGELYRRSAAQQDPIWEAPPAAEPLPEPGQPDPAAAWPFEETTQSWEPSDRSFIWPADELPTTPTEWEPAASPSWMDDPAPAPQPPIPPSDQTSAWPGPGPTPEADQGSAWPPATEPGSQPGGQASAWSAGPALGNGVPPPPPPADWAAAIPTDVPAARRGSDPGAATRSWRPDQAFDVEPAVPLGRAERPPATAPAPAPAEPAEALGDEPAEGRRVRQLEDGPSRSWPRIVAVISWIVLVMVVCWFYVFPWLERILPESF